MRVLSIGLPFGGDLAPIRLFRSRQGHDVRVLTTDEDGDYRFSPGETTVEVLRRVGRQWSVDAILCWLPEYYPPPRQIENSPVPTCALISDWNLYFARMARNLARYDHVLCDRLGEKTLQAPGVQPRFLFPLYSHRRMIHRRLAIERDLDVVFIGNLNASLHRERNRRLESLARIADRRKIVIAHGVYGEDYVRLLNRARIVVNYSVRREMNLRAFEAIGCGALLFVEEENLETGQILRDGVEFVAYREDNFIPLLDHYLDREEERKRIAEAGRLRSPELAGEFHLDALIDWLGANSFGERTFRSWPESTRRLAEIEQYAESRRAGQPELADELIDEALRAEPSHAAIWRAAGLRAAYRCLGADHPEILRQTARMVECFAQGCELEPDAAVGWINLGHAHRQAGARSAEVAALQRVMTAPSTAFGEQSLMRMDDPFYLDWIRSVATGSSDVSQLRAAAAFYLGETLFEAGHLDDVPACVSAATSIAPEIPDSYRLLAAAERKKGNREFAADLLAGSLPLTSFAAQHRMDLLRLLLELGRREEAQRLAGESAVIFSAVVGLDDTVSQFRAVAESLCMGG